MKGFELHKTGERVKELLERHFIVPTLDKLPDTQTKSWVDGSYTVEFRIGELCRIEEGRDYVFYRLVHIDDDGSRIWKRIDSIETSIFDNYYTKKETDEKIDEKFSKIEIPEDESIKNVTQEEFDALYKSDLLSASTIYFISEGGEPIALYIGKIQIAVREEGSKGFAYNFPIIF